METGHFRHMLIGLIYLYFISFGVVCFKYLILTSTKNSKPSFLRLKIEHDIGERLAYNVRKKFKLTSYKGFRMKEDAIYRKQVFMANYRPKRNSAGINCQKVINNDQTEISRSRQIIRKSSYFTSNFYFNITRKCDLFRESRGYIEHPLSKTEFEFPVAFSILVYRDIEQVERLIRVMYRPHNYYCIHVDSKMDAKEKNAVRMIAKCLNNVFMSNESIDVIWGHISLLEAELSCMKTLWPFKKWRYYINLAGQEFPLKTNREIIAFLKDLDGANVVHGTFKRSNTRAAMKTTPPPHNISLIKGSMQIAATRYFVDSCIHDKRSLEFLEWLRETHIPDEFYFASLHYNKHLGIIGSYHVGWEAQGFDIRLQFTRPFSCSVNHWCEIVEHSMQQGFLVVCSGNKKSPSGLCCRFYKYYHIDDAKRSHWSPFILRYVIWNKGRASCSGYFIRGVCILGVSELYRAYNSVALYANKFHLDYEHIALDCLEEVLYEKTWQEYIEDIPVNTF